MRGSHAFGSFPPMSSCHRNLEPLGRWYATIYKIGCADLALTLEYIEPLYNTKGTRIFYYSHDPMNVIL